MIPNITHQTAANSDLPDWCRQLRQQMQTLHPTWEHRFYDDAACRELIRREMPCLLPVYDNYTSDIQRVDVFRVVAVYVHGGFYLDLDIACRQPVDPLCGFSFVLGIEKTLTPAESAQYGHRDAVRVANYMFGSEPQHPFWLDVLAEMVRRAKRQVRCENDILESTGPGLLTTVYHQVGAQDRTVTLLPNHTNQCIRCGGISCQFGDYASHLHLGSWRWEHSTSQSSPVAPADRTASNDRQTTRLIETRREIQTQQGACCVLRTYGEEKHDGLSSVFAKTAELGEIVDDTRDFEGQRVLVAGIPFLYTDRLSRRNTNILFTTFESTQLPNHWINAINSCYDVCVVPHESIKDVFGASGVRVPIYVAPLGFTRYPRRATSEIDPNLFRVGFLGVPVVRKNLHKLYLACKSLVAEIPSLRLAIHVAKLYDWLDPKTWDAVKSSPFVEWSEGVWTQERVADWYQSLSCYAYPSSAEGWSFTPRESIFLGVPTVVSDIPLHADLIASRCCAAIACDGLEPATFEGGTFGHWHHVTIEDIARVLRKVHRDHSAWIERAASGALWIEKKWMDISFQRTLLDIISEL